MLVNNDSISVKYYIQLSNGSSLGPYDSRALAEQSKKTLPITESNASIVPKTENGSYVLLG